MMEAQQNKFLTLMLEEEYYGIPILKVKEIIGILPITHIPKMPEFVKGVINLRGKIIPVVDLRLKFGLGSAEYTDRTCIIVVEMESEHGKTMNGLVVDCVSEVLDIPTEAVEPIPSYEDDNIDVLTGIGKVKEKVIMLLDTDKILSSHEIHTISKISE